MNKQKSAIMGSSKSIFHIKSKIRPLLTNESEVESNIMDPILKDLGWDAENIKHKHSLEEFQCGTGRTKLYYKPDYVIVDDKKVPLLVLDAKSPEEKLENYIDQCSSYCFHLNKNEETVKYFILSSGVRTIAYDWKGANKIIELNFNDFTQTTNGSKQFYDLFSKEALTRSDIVSPKSDRFTMKSISKEAAQKLFKLCHKDIWKSEKMGVNGSFMEFIKLIFLKLASDKRIHEKYHFEPGAQSIKVDINDVLFSTAWIDKNTSDLEKNPIKDIQFKNLTEELKKEIKKNKKKPLFDDNETIILKADTIRKVVSRLEKVDLYGIDEDLNGRLFETFLNATMRGNDLGQYFTPRSIVKLGVSLADLKASKDHIDKVLDGCCGTGGFLIEAYSVMKKKILSIGNYTDKDKKDCLNNLASNSIYGIDAAKDPKLARIARINMYLHGDGGSNIYLGDGLSKSMTPDATDIDEIKDEMEKMQEVFLPNSFDVVLTNPPFSMDLSMANEQDKKILKDYELLTYEGTKKSLRSGIMFIERYEGLLKEGGKLISVIDNTVLSSNDYKFFRDYLREKFIIVAIISLHGDAFQQSKARVKTSLIYLRKKKGDEKQPDAFMEFSTKLGVDDLPITSKQSNVDIAREQAQKEINKIIDEFHSFENGKDGQWRVKASRLTDRLDVKYCIPLQGRFVNKWKSDGYDIKPLSDFFTVVSTTCSPKEKPDQTFKILSVQYDGVCQINEERVGSEVHGKGYIVHKNDIVFSRYNAFQGAVGFVTEEFDGAFASSSYIVLKPKDVNDAIYIWSVIRLTEIRADILDSAIGMGRSTIEWSDIKSVKIPYIKDTSLRMKYVNDILSSWNSIKSAKNQLKLIQDNLGNIFGTEGESSIDRYEANKPPK